MGRLSEYSTEERAALTGPTIESLQAELAATQYELLTSKLPKSNCCRANVYDSHGDTHCAGCGRVCRVAWR